MQFQDGFRFLGRQLAIATTFIRWTPVVYHLGKRSIIKKPQLISNPRSISIGDYTTIEEGCVFADLQEGIGTYPKIVIGNYCTFLFRFQCNASISVKFGDHVLCASNVLITDSDHIVSAAGIPVTKNNSFNSQSVKIGSNCWIGQNAVILKGVHIGNNSIVGANSVVTKSFPPSSVIAGNPAKLIKNIPSSS